MNTAFASFRDKDGRALAWVVALLVVFKLFASSFGIGYAAAEEANRGVICFGAMGMGTGGADAPAGGHEAAHDPALCAIACQAAGLSAPMLAAAPAALPPRMAAVLRVAAMPAADGPTVPARPSPFDPRGPPRLS